MPISGYQQNLQELESFAKQKMNVGSITPEVIQDSLRDSSINKAFLLAESLKGSKRDNWTAWRKQTKDLPELGEDYWNLAEQLYPGPKESMYNSIMEEVDYNLKTRMDSAEKEMYLRNAFSGLPDRLRTHYEPTLRVLSSQVATQNYYKSVATYKDSLSKKAERFKTEELDIDVPESEHLKDFLKIESLNLLELSQVKYGRLGIQTKDGNFTAATDINNRAAVFPDGDNDIPPSPSEVRLISEVAPEFFTNVIKTSMAASQTRMKDINRASTELGFKMLESGQLPVEQWHEALGIMQGASGSEVIRSGLKGLVDFDKIKNQKDLLDAMDSIRTLYGKQLNEPT